MRGYHDEPEKPADYKTYLKVFTRLFRFIITYYPILILLLVCIVYTAFAESLGTYYVKKVIDEGILKKDLSMLVRYIIYYSLIMFFVGFAIFGFIACAGYLGELTQYNLRKKLFEHLQTLSFSYFDKTPVGWIMSRLTSDTNRIADLISWYLLDFLWAVVNITSAIAFMIIINAKLGLIITAIMPVVIITGLKFQKYIVREYRKVRSLNSEITGAYNENITGVRVVKAMVKERFNLGLFDTLTTKMHNASFKATWLSAMFLPLVQIITAFGCGVVMWYGGMQVKTGVFTIGGIQAFVTYLTFMMWPVQDLARVYAQMQQSFVSAERVFNLLDTKPEIQNRSNSNILSKLSGKVELRNVGFWYKDDDVVIKDFNLVVNPGETIALVGPTGGGKTTIVNLISRFYEPRKGRILIDNADYTNFTQESLQARFGVMLQTPFLFSGSIKENIRYGRLSATDEEIYEAAKIVCAHDFIMDLQRGYDEVVGEGGVLLSVGQKQLISMARAILSQPDIMIMDEATSSIDTMTEQLIQKGLEALLRNCTSFIIAHRLSTIKKADKILVIEDGKVQESGNHATLLLNKGKYYRLYSESKLDAMCE